MDPSIVSTRRLFHRAFLVIACSFGLIGPLPAEAALIRFKAAAEVRSSIVRLGDVAEVADADPQRQRQLEQIALRPAPGEGRSVRLDFDSIRSRLIAHGVNLAQTEFTGSSSVLVTTPGAQKESRPAVKANDKSIQADSPKPGPSAKVVQASAVAVANDFQQRRAESLLAEAAEQHIRRNVPASGKLNVAVEIPRDQTLAILEAAASGFEIRSGLPPFEGEQTLVVRFLDRQNQIREVEFTCRAEPCPKVWGVRHAVASGHVLQSGDLMLLQVADAAGYIGSDQDLAGMETKRPVAQGAALRTSDVQQVPLVRSNDIVTVYSRSRGVSVSRPFKARSEGMLGDTINLVTLDGRERIVGRVIGLHEAEIISRGSSLADIFTDSTGRIEFQANKSPAAKGRK
jgi:flagellar basal body P-ring formation protein FlgA